MKMKILLTGKNGQVGTDLAQLLPRLGDVVALDRKQLNLAKPEEIRQAIRRIRPQIVVNAAAYTAVDQAEKEEALAHTINAEAPAIMAEEAQKIGALFVHYSTDYVFDGTKTTPYTEEDEPNPINAYGRTKLAGERLILAAGAAHLIFRIEWVYAPRGRNFLLTILRLATEREDLKIVCDQTGSPTWSREIARATTKVLEQCIRKGSLELALPHHQGIHHMTASGVTNWYEFTRAILEEAAGIQSSTNWFQTATSEKPLIARRVIPITTSQYLTPARRPAYSVLSNGRLEKDFGIRISDWRVQLHSVFSPDVG
jgi:dTDP-4-dehydrorhamnose reductase